MKNERGIPVLARILSDPIIRKAIYSGILPNYFKNQIQKNLKKLETIEEIKLLLNNDEKAFQTIEKMVISTEYSWTSMLMILYKIKGQESENQTLGHTSEICKILKSVK